MAMAIKESLRFIWTHPRLRSEGYSPPRECDACGATFTVSPDIEMCFQSIVVTHDLKILGGNCFPRTRKVVSVCYRCLPPYVEPLEASGYDLSDIAINGIPYVIYDTRELAVLKEIANWNCFHSGSWVFTSFNPPKAQAFLRTSPMAMIEMTDFPDPRFRLKLEVKKVKRVFFSKIEVEPETSYQEVIALAQEAEAAIRKKYKTLIASGN